MKRNYSIDIQKCKEMKISTNEWMILENIQFRCNLTGYCEDSKNKLAEHHGMSRNGYNKSIDKLIDMKLVLKNSKVHLKVTAKYIKLMSVSVCQLSGQHDKSDCQLSGQNTDNLVGKCLHSKKEVSKTVDEGDEKSTKVNDKYLESVFNQIWIEHYKKIDELNPRSSKGDKIDTKRAFNAMWKRVSKLGDSTCDELSEYIYQSIVATWEKHKDGNYYIPNMKKYLSDIETNIEIEISNENEETT